MTMLRVELSSPQTPDIVLQDRTRALGRDIEQQSDARAELPLGAAVENSKGEPVTLGVLLVTFMTSGAAVAALNVLKSYLERDRSLAMTVEKPDGTKITLTAADMGDVEDLAKRIVPVEG